MTRLFGQALRKARLAAGFTVLQLARELRLSRNTIHNWESGLTEPVVSDLFILASHLHCSVYDLLGEPLRCLCCPRCGHTWLEKP
jgi:transcriptional regulator with XRE-family HTH domain